MNISKFKTKGFSVAITLLCSANGLHAENENHAIQLRGYSATPSAITIEQGDTITWRNGESKSHTIRFEGEDRQLRIPAFSKTPLKMSSTGIFHYHCATHNAMKGAITVIAANPSAANPPPKGASNKAPPTGKKQHGKKIEIIDFMQFSPKVLTAVIGDEITWINHDGSNHIISIDGQKSPRLGHDASYTWTANRTGTIPYECAIHGKRMKGEIIVGNPK